MAFIVGCESKHFNRFVAETICQNVIALYRKGKMKVLINMERKFLKPLKWNSSGRMQQHFKEFGHMLYHNAFVFEMSKFGVKKWMFKHFPVVYFDAF